MIQFVLFSTGHVSYKIPHVFFPSINEPRDTVGSASILWAAHQFFHQFFFLIILFYFNSLLSPALFFTIITADFPFRFKRCSSTEKFPGRLLSSKRHINQDRTDVRLVFTALWAILYRVTHNDRVIVLPKITTPLFYHSCNWWLQN